MRTNLTPDISVKRLVPQIKWVRSAKPPEELAASPTSVEVVEADAAASASPETPILQNIIEAAHQILHTRGAYENLSRNLLFYQDDALFLHRDAETLRLWISIFAPTIAQSWNLDSDWVTVLDLDDNGAISTLKAWIEIEHQNCTWHDYLTELASLSVEVEVAIATVVEQPTDQSEIKINRLLVAWWQHFGDAFQHLYQDLQTSFFLLEEAIDILMSFLEISEDSEEFGGKTLKDTTHHNDDTAYLIRELLIRSQTAIALANGEIQLDFGPGHNHDSPNAS